MKIVIPGGSGQVGNILARHLLARGHDVFVISRNENSRVPWTTLQWDGENLGEWMSAFEGADAVIHMSGRSVDCRYNAKNRKAILESRTHTTSLVGKAIAQCSAKPRAWLNASTSTLYRHALDRPMDEFTGEIGGDYEKVPATWHFSVNIAKAWEAAFEAAETPGVRKIALRTSMVMSPDRNGVFDVLMGLVIRGLGGRHGNGRQYVSWCHDQDYARAVEFLIQNEEIHGPVNLTAPKPLPNSEFMRGLREASGIRFGLPASRWMLELGAIFMRTETELILKSRYVVPGVLEQAGFEFLFPEWSTAARNLVRRWKKLRGLN